MASSLHFKCFLAGALFAAAAALPPTAAVRADSEPSKPEPASTIVGVPTSIPSVSQLLVDTMPGNGGLPIATGYDVTKLIAEVRGANDTIIEGSLVQVQGVVVWRPNSPLEPGRYWMNLRVDKYPATVSLFTVTEARPVARPDVSSVFELKRVDQAQAERCCTDLDGARSSCFATISASYVSLSVSLTTALSTPELSQFLFAFTADDFPTGNDFTSWRPAYGPFVSQTDQENYCFSLRAVDVGSGKLFDYDDLMPHCRAGSEIGKLGSHVIQVGSRELGQANCQIPPRQYAEAWCEINQAECGADRTLGGCAKYGETCLGEAAPKPADSTNAGGPAPALGIVDANAMNTLQRDPKHAADGCSVGRVHGGVGLFELLGLALFGIIGWRLALKCRLRA